MLEEIVTLLLTYYILMIESDIWPMKLHNFQ